MSDNQIQRGKVISFQRAAAAAAAAKAAAEIRELLIVYEALIGLLRETDDEGLDALTDGMVLSVVRCREVLAKKENPDEFDANAGQFLLREMKQDLREFPATLRSLLPGIGPRLGESIEYKLGIQFARY